MLEHLKKAEKCAMSTMPSAFVFGVVLPSLECEFLEGSDHSSFTSVSSEFISESSPKQ